MSAIESDHKNVLIVYASNAGATAEIATYIKTYLEGDGLSVEMMDAEGVKTDLSNYDLIILGSAIKGNFPNNKIIDFIRLNSIELNEKKTAVFAVCITITSSKENKRSVALTYPDKIAFRLKPLSKAVFAGVAESSGWFGNLMGKLTLGITPGDYRDWDKIEQWADELREKLKN
jgi:menaquinone-dependent protoporphyrinogen oxidase